MSTNAPSREELLALVQAFRRERETHRRAAFGTHARDLSEDRLRTLGTTFERTLRGWGVDERLRRAWRDALHHNAPVPLRPVASRTIAFRGRSDANVDVEVFAARDGSFEPWIGGAAVDRLHGLDLVERDGRTFLRVGGQLYEERCTAPREALDALRRWVDAPNRVDPPFDHARALVEDGLVDGDFSLTTRGRRIVRARVPEMA